MRKREVQLGLAVLIVLVPLVVLLGGCPPKEPDTGIPPPPPQTGPPPSGGENAVPQPTAAAPTGEAIKIGAIFSVTGGNAPLGSAEKNAAELIEAQTNAKGGVLGRPIKVIIKDDKSVPDEAVNAAKDLINSDKVCAIIGPSGTPTTMPIKQTCQDAKVPLISCAAGNAITHPVASFVFAVPQTDTLAVSRIVVYLTEKKIKKVATIYVKDPFGESGQDQLKALLPKAGIEILASESFGKDDKDMTAQLTTIKGKNPEAVICWGTNPGPAQVTKDMKKLGFTCPLIQSHGVASPKFLELAGDAAEGVMLPAGRLLVWEAIPDTSKQKPILKEFAEAYKAKYDNKPPSTFAGHAYDALHIVLKALNVAGSDDRAKLRDAIEKTKDFVGTAGVFNYTAEDHNGLTKDAFVWVKVQGGKWTLAE